MTLTDAQLAQFTRLLDESTIRDLVGRYTSGLDWLNAPLLESLFWPDAKVDFGEMFRGDPAEFIPFVSALEQSYTRRLHIFGNLRIALFGDDAEAEAATVTHARTVSGDQRIDDRFWGRYLLRFQRRRGEWRFSGLLYMLNGIDRTEGPNTPEGPLNLGDDTSMSHPLAPRF